MPKDEKPLNPPPGVPVRAFNAPAHIEAVHVERVDITSTTYQKLPRGTLYSTVPGADSKVIADYPGIYLLREIISPATHPWAFRYFGLGELFVTKRIGQPNLTPEKYRRLVRDVETNQVVSADYTFPSGLTGDQVQIELAQETIEEARLKIIEELINIGGDALPGQETGEYGIQYINETVVNDGSPADEGFQIAKSSVTPFGNGKSVKITAFYKQGFVGLVLVTNLGSGYSSAPAVQFSGGGGTGAAATAVIASNQVIRIDITNFGSGYTSEPSVALIGGGGTGATAEAILSISRLEGQEYDRRYGVIIPTVTLVVPTGKAIGIPNADITPIDYLKSRVRTVDTTKIAAVLAAIKIVMPGRTNIHFPNILESIRIIFHTAQGNGFSQEAGTAQSGGTSWSFDVNAQASSQGSASIIPEAVPQVRSIFAYNIPTIRGFVFLPIPVSEADILAAISTTLGVTVLDWPKFNPVEHTIVCSGTNLSLQAKASARFSESSSSGSGALAQSSGFGTSKETGITRRTTHIGATIHASITPISDIPPGAIILPTKAEAHATALTIVVNEVVQDTIGFNVYPSTLDATGGDDSIPTTGYRLLDAPSEPAFYGFAGVNFEVVNFADIPNTTGGQSSGPGGGATGPPGAPIITYGPQSPQIQNTSVFLYGSINPNNADTSYHWEYGTTSAYGSTSPANYPGYPYPIPAGITMFDNNARGQITGLTPSTTYHYRLVATNSQGTTNGSDQTFNTTAYAIWQRTVRCQVKIHADEIAATGLSNDLITLEDHSSNYQVGVYADLTNSDLYVYIGNPSSPAATASVHVGVGFSGTYIQLILEVWSDGSLIHAYVNANANQSNEIHDTGGQHLDRFEAGGKNTRGGALLHRRLTSMLVSSGSNITNDIFDGTLSGTVVPPFDSISGSGVTVVGSGLSEMLVSNATAAYAIKSISST